MDRLKIGIIGCGNISKIYLKNMTTLFHNLVVTCICDQNEQAVKQTGEKFGITKIYTDPSELVKDPEIDMVLILTPPESHAKLCILGLNAGKHVYCEKPLAVDLTDAGTVLRLAQEKGLYAGCAPDTFLGAGVQTCRKLIEDGWIGTPVGTGCNIIMFGPETWHPNPAFFYQKGAGPVLDWGPYYIACLTAMLGSVKCVQSTVKTTYQERIITCKERFGERIKVEVPTYVSGILEFANGVIGSITITFDVCSATDLGIEIRGSEGTLIVPNPDTFGGPDGSIRYKKLSRVHRDINEDKWTALPHLYPYSENSRGIGLSDMADAILHNRKPRANSEFAYHTLEVLLALQNAGETIIQSRCDPISVFPLGLLEGNTN